MDLNLTEQQKKVLDASKEICSKVISPAAEKVDNREMLAHEHFGALAEAGLLAIALPEEYGGPGGDLISLALCLEELAAACTSTAFAVHASGSVSALPILLYGTDEQKKKFLPPLAGGTAVGCFALTEPHCGSDVSAIETRAEKKGGKYILNGTKAYVTHGPVMDSGVVFARTSDQPGAKGISGFIIEKGMPGISVGAEYDMMCTRGLALSELVFDNCEVPEENLLGEEDHGVRVALDSLEYGRITMSAIGLGLVRAAMEESIECCETRWAFGKPLGGHQELNHKVSTMRMNLEVGRQLVYYAAWMKQRGEKCGPDVSIAKLFTAETAFNSVADAVQIHGSAGLTHGSKVERLYRDVKVCSMAGGTTEVMKVVIARDTLEE